eukprot:TRINITY_DN2712_c0_g1_i8.p1 TRINITY_DN2712_c0_g1~~TRINITY_DN2712_c0_g1_i8.p1  ORF type:complete len:308 (+),score=68.48 TRINITY_DN2712_c0_g1_i8:133-1056(+)
MQRGLVGSEMCIRDRYQRRVHGEHRREEIQDHIENEGDDNEEYSGEYRRQKRGSQPWRSRGRRGRGDFRYRPRAFKPRLPYHEFPESKSLTNSDPNIALEMLKKSHPPYILYFSDVPQEYNQKEFAAFFDFPETEIEYFDINEEHFKFIYFVRLSSKTEAAKLLEKFIENPTIDGQKYHLEYRLAGKSESSLYKKKFTHFEDKKFVKKPKEDTGATYKYAKKDQYEEEKGQFFEGYPQEDFDYPSGEEYQSEYRRPRYRYSRRSRGDIRGGRYPRGERRRGGRSGYRKKNEDEEVEAPVLVLSLIHI